jgi:tetratricopeptide (TPR) repeat protein/predicted Ser/Thr protein kinase
MSTPAIGKRADAGAVIANRYRILERIGEGGMGAVYKVLDLALDRVVALKTIHPRMAQNALALEMFKKEVILARQVTHKNVCRVFDLGEDHGAYFLTMEFVEGQSLSKLIKLKQKCTPVQAAEIMLQAIRGLEAAHETGIIHRDLKPDNIMIQSDGRVLVMDFGIAMAVQEQGATSSGTPAYASPEQLLGQPQGRTSDLFSIGMIFYELLCAEPPFSPPKTLREARGRAIMTAPSLNVRDPSIPRPLTDIVARCLALRPEDRFTSARELAASLDGWLHPKPFYATPAFTWSSAAGIALLAIGAVVWSTRPPSPAPPPVSLLIADFENRAQDPVFDGTLEPTLQVAVEGASFITAYDRGQAKRLIAQLRPGDPRLDVAGAQLIAAREGIAAVLGGSIERVGNKYTLTLHTINPTDGKELVKEQRTTIGRDQVLAAVAKLATPLRRGLGDSTPASEQISAAETVTAASLDAAKKYSMAQELASNPAQRDEAARAYEEAIRLDPEMGRAYSGLAVVLRNQGRLSDALKNYELALSRLGRMSEREQLRTRGGYYMTANNPGKAAEEYSALLQKYPADTSGHSNLALALLYLRQPRRALEEGRRAVAIYPKNLSFRTNVALYGMYAGDYQTAVNEASAVLKEDARVPNAYIALALSAVMQQRPQEAREWYEKLGALNPASASRAVAGLADLAVLEGRLDDAVSTLRRGIAMDESAQRRDAAAHKYADLAAVYAELNRRADAEQAAGRAVAATIDLGALTEAALVYVDVGVPAKAAVIAGGFREKFGSPNQAVSMLIEGYSQMVTAPVQALDTFGQAQKALDTWLGHFLLGRAALLTKQYVDAQREFDICVRRSSEAAALFVDDVPTSRYLPATWFYLAETLKGLKDSAATESYQRFLSFQVVRSQDPRAPVARSGINSRLSTQ